MSMEVECLFYLANIEFNEFMKRLDLKLEYTWFVQTQYVVIDYNPVVYESIEDFLFNIIELSRKEKTYWIPAIKYNLDIYSPSDVDIIVTKRREMFVRGVRTKDD